MAQEKYTVLDKILDFMEQYPNGFIPRMEMQKRLGINYNTCKHLMRNAYLYGLVEQSGTPHNIKYRIKEKNRDKWKIVYKKPTKEWRSKVLNE